MAINFFGISQNNLNTVKKLNKANISFKGTNDVNDLEKKSDIPPSNCYSVKIHPLFAFTMQLLKDGYTKEEIDQAHMFRIIDFHTPSGYRNKSNADVKAMHKAYLSLKKSYNTMDVQQQVLEQNKFYMEFESFLKSKGKEVKDSKSCDARSMMLSVLYRVDKNNEPLLQELLDDQNFNNVYIDSALMDVFGNKNPKYGLQVLRMAQEIGYDKEFSFPLAILISEADENNLPIIEKIILNEQDFFVDNDDFTSTKLMRFLRGEDGFAQIYEQDDDITLREIQEILENEEDDEG